MMTTLQRLLLSLAIFVIGELASAERPFHYHRYMLSDYRRQHNPKTQDNYKPVPRPDYPPDPPRKPSLVGELVVDAASIGSSRSFGVKKLSVESLTVSLKDKNKICMGTVMSGYVVATTEVCSQELDMGRSIVKTSSGHVIKVKSINTTLGDNNSKISKLNLEYPVIDEKIMPVTCSDLLKPGSMAEVTIQNKTDIVKELVNVVPDKYCLNSTDATPNDKSRKTVCVKNKKTSTGCQENYGSPLIYNGQICGINLSGHKCLSGGRYDLYAIVLNETAYEKHVVAAVNASRLESDII